MLAVLLLFGAPLLLNLFVSDAVKVRLPTLWGRYWAVFAAYSAGVVTEVFWLFIAYAFTAQGILRETDGGSAALFFGLIVYSLTPLVIAGFYLEAAVKDLPIRKKLRLFLFIYLLSSIVMVPFYRPRL